jgi:two-component system chemotaxis response regulator CheB
MAGKIRVLIVHDNPAFRLAMSVALGSDPEVEVVGRATGGKEAVELVPVVRPDVITMDVLMPNLDGTEAAKLILENHAIPILLMTSLARTDEGRMAFNSMRLGVVDVLNKPVLSGPGASAAAAELIRMVKAATRVDVRVRPRSGRYHRATAEMPRRPTVITIAASTGGPPALERLLQFLPASFPPIVVAQHLARDFTRGFAGWLELAAGRPVVTVEVSDPLVPGNIYIPGESRHIRLRPGAVDAVDCDNEALAPSADLLFQSAASAYGRAALGIVLSGMGEDGAIGLKAMRAQGAWTIGQDRDTATVYGMPKAAADANALSEVLSLDEIAERLVSVAGVVP